jgi:magnesium transporter
VPYHHAVPNLALPRSLPRPHSRRRPDGTVDAPMPETIADPEIIDAAGLRWIHIESPRTADRDWLEEHFDFHPLDYEDVFSRNQRPKLDQYDDYGFIVLHFPLFDKDTGRILTAELDVFMGPDYLITLPNIPLPPLSAMFERYREKDDLRQDVFSKGPGYLLYKIVDTGVDASFPMLPRPG